MTRAALLVASYWLIAFASYEGTLWLVEQAEAHYVYAVLTTVVSLTLFGATIPARFPYLVTLFGAASLATFAALAAGLLPLHDVDNGFSNPERLNYFLPWLLILFAPIAVGAGLRRAFIGK